MNPTRKSDPSALSWLEPHLTGSEGCGQRKIFERFDSDLGHTLRSVGGRLSGTALLRVKKSLAYLGYGAMDSPEEVGGRGESSTIQMLIQFGSGYRDLNLRDAAHVGHGRVVLTRGSSSSIRRWAPEIVNGALCGIAMTEEVGGTAIRRTRTTIRRNPDGGWLMAGEKCWVSRVLEASCFVVLCRVDHTGELAMVLVDQARPGLIRTILTPFGLQGWSWGKLRFEDVLVNDEDFLGTGVDGLQVIRDHFCYYRPMVAATCLGAAAAIVDTIQHDLLSRHCEGNIESYRDSALELFGRTRTNIHAMLSLALTTARLVEQGHPQANQLASGIKAVGIDVAYDLSQRIALLGGARHMQEDSPVAKRLRDLRAYLCADGIHDELLRSVGRAYLELRTPKGVDELTAINNGRDGEVNAQWSQPGIDDQWSSTPSGILPVHDLICYYPQVVKRHQVDTTPDGKPVIKLPNPPAPRHPGDAVSITTWTR